MIKFMQKYQKVLYIVITAMTVISFSFFGTYGSLSAPSERETTAFTTLGGKEISRYDLETMNLFLQSDLDDKRVMGPYWGPNFLNDGVIRKDFLESGLAMMLIQDYPQYFDKELTSKINRESSFAPYVHPNAPYISAETAWRYFAPQMGQALNVIKAGGNPLSNELLGARVDLYLGQKGFPAPYLAEVLRRQESQFEWVKKDPKLNGRDLSLFGYQNLNDWFGVNFTRLIAEFIFNAAEVAQSKGYKVTREEAWADLLTNGSKSYQEVSRYPQVEHLSQGQYISEQLRSMGIDKTQATDLWQQVLLFRRLFHDVANGALIAPELFHDYSTWSNASVTGMTYTLPQPLHFSGVQDLADFELYLAETAAPAAGLELPSKSLSVDAIQKKTPELVEKRALVKVKRADKKGLESKISLKETLEWEEKAENFATLRKTFPDLGVKEAATAEERVAALDALPDRTREKVDSFAREQIVASRADWIQQALNQAPVQEQVVSLRSKGGKDPLPGVTDRMAFLKALESSGKGKSFQYPTDSGVYEIELIEISPSWEIVSFEEARNQGILSELLLAKLTPYYKEIREKHSDQFRTKEGTWKPIEEAKQAVLEYYLEPKFELIRKETEANIKENYTPVLIASTLPSYRFVGWAAKVRSAKDKTPYVYEQAPQGDQLLPHKESWADQFKWRVSERSFPRSAKEEGRQDYIPGKEKLFALKAGEFSELMTPPNGDIQFVEVGSASGQIVDKEVEEAVLNVRALLGGEAERNYMKTLLSEIKAKKGISFDWLNVSDEGAASVNL